MKIAKANDFRFSQMLICHAFGKYNEEMISIYPDNAQAYAQAVIDMYQTALKLAKMLVLSEYETTIRKDIVSFKRNHKDKCIIVVTHSDMIANQSDIILKLNTDIKGFEEIINESV